MFSIAEPLLPRWREKSGPKKGPVIEMIRRHGRKRLLITLIILVMVLEDRSHDFLAWENSRLFLKFEHSLLNNKDNFLTGGSHRNNQEWRKGTLKIIFLLSESALFTFLLSFEIKEFLQNRKAHPKNRTPKTVCR